MRSAALVIVPSRNKSNTGSTANCPSSTNAAAKPKPHTVRVLRQPENRRYNGSSTGIANT